MVRHHHPLICSVILIVGITVAGAGVAAAKPIDYPRPANNGSPTAANHYGAGRSTTAAASSLHEPLHPAPTAAELRAINRSELNREPVLASTGAAHLRAFAAKHPVHVISQTAGFNWGDAGIGAAGGLALALFGAGGVLAISQYRARRGQDTRALSG